MADYPFFTNVKRRDVEMGVSFSVIFRYITFERSL